MFRITVTQPQPKITLFSVLKDKLFNNGEKYFSDNEQLSDVKTKWKPKEGIFTKKAETIRDYLLKNSQSQAQAMRRLNFYINRAGKDLPNREEVLRAKRLLEKSE